MDGSVEDHRLPEEGSPHRRISRRRILRTLALGVAAALGAGYVTRRSAKGAPEPATAAIRRAYGTDASQFGDLRLPPRPGPHPVLLVVHGGFWLSGYDLTLMNALCDAFTAGGVATWNIEYRRVGDEGGGFPGTFLDVAAAADFLARLASEFTLDLARVVTLGHSAGGHLALWLAARSRISSGELRPAQPLVPLHGAISLAGVVDLRLASTMGLTTVDHLMGGSSQQVPERYRAGSPAELLPLGVPQLLIHGRNDTIVPLEISERYCEVATARGDRATLTALDGIGHFELIDPGSAAWAVVRTAVQSMLRWRQRRRDVTLRALHFEAFRPVTPKVR
jgi:acetyl esterase/lipase